MSEAAERPTYSIVVPVFDEEESLPEFGRRLGRVLDALDGSSEVVLVDDGSRDRSYELMLELAAADGRFRILRLSRNFGHQYAITAGLDVARGDAVVILDADLQDPPEVIPKLVERWRDGYEVVYAVRERREGESWFKRASAALFYFGLRQTASVELPPAAGDFRLLDRRALDVLARMREQTRYVRGMTAWVGFRQVGVPYVRAPRFAGRSNYTLPRMLRFAGDATLSFSELPLLAVLRIGVLVAVASMLYGAVSVALKLSGADFVPGWGSIIAVVTFVSGIQLIVLATIGAYVARVFQEVKQRPLYVVRDAHGFETAAGSAAPPPETARADDAQR